MKETKEIIFEKKCGKSRSKDRLSVSIENIEITYLVDKRASYHANVDYKNLSNPYHEFMNKKKNSNVFQLKIVILRKEVIQCELS